MISPTSRNRVYGFRTLLSIVLLLHCAIPAYSNEAPSIQSKKLRVIATTDGEIDDRCSMVRFLLYTNEWDIKGIIHSSSKFHWKGDETHLTQDWNPVGWLDKKLEAYAQVYPNLLKHDVAYPTPAYLRSQVFVGNIGYVGEMEKVTPGSQRIVEVLLEKDDSPIWLQAWGGSNTIARALKTIQDDYPDRVEEVTKKARLFLIAKQDNTLDEYIKPQWPGLQVLLSDWHSFEAIAYGWGKTLAPEQKVYFGRKWMTPNILEDHGALNALYEHKEGRFRSEGDTPSYLHVINNGLRSDESPAYGGWGGRFEPKEGIWISVDVRGTPVHSISRWAIDFQNDWAARSDWCVKEYDDANHAPKAQLTDDTQLSAKPGTVVMLDASASTDPDGDTLHYNWWHYTEAGSYHEAIAVSEATSPNASVTIPENAKPGDTIHIICSVSDAGTPPLTNYARVILTVN